jgi:hypothetical protein
MKLTHNELTAFTFVAALLGTGSRNPHEHADNRDSKWCEYLFYISSTISARILLVFGDDHGTKSTVDVSPDSIVSGLAWRAMCLLLHIAIKIHHTLTCTT